MDAGEAEVERWFVAATLFGARIPARVVEQAFGVLAAAGLARIGPLRHVPTADLIDMLDAGDYARYDFCTATRLLQLCEVRVGEALGCGGEPFAAVAESRSAVVFSAGDRAYKPLHHHYVAYRGPSSAPG